MATNASCFAPQSTSRWEVEVGVHVGKHQLELRPSYVTRDDQDIVIPLCSGAWATAADRHVPWRHGTDYLSMGVLPEPEKVIDGIHPAAVVDSLDARTLYVAADNGNLYRIDRESFQVIGEPLPYPVTDASTLEMRTKTYMAISPDGRNLVINAPRAFLTVVDNGALGHCPSSN